MILDQTTVNTFLQRVLSRRQLFSVLSHNISKNHVTMPPKRKSEENGHDESTNGASKPKAQKRESIPDLSTMDFSSSATTSDGKPWNLKFASWNVNGIRAWVEKNGHSYLTAEQPDVFCVQETKCDKSKLPAEAAVPGYTAYWLSGDKDGYSGTGMYCKTPPLEVTYGIGDEEHDQEGRVITAEFDKYYFVTVYVPNAGRKLVRLEYRIKWDIAFRNYLKQLDAKKPVVLCGDLNVAHLEIDLANPKTNKKNAGFTKEERDAFTELLDAGFIDSFRHLYPEQTKAYTFWTYMMNARAKDVGWRLDYFVVSERLKASVCDSVIRKTVMGSDHCPVVCLMNIE